MCSRPALPNSWAANGPVSSSCSACIASRWRSIGLTRSSKCIFSEPRSIFSNPTASTQSASPPATSARARYSDVEPVEQLLFTLTIGMPVSPSSYIARCPAVESP